MSYAGTIAIRAKGLANWPPVQATRFLFRSFCDILMPQNWTFKNRDFLNSDDEEEEEDVSGQRRIRSSWTDQLNPQQQQQQSVNSGSTKESNRFDYPPPATPQNNNSQQQQQPVNPSSGGRKLNSGMYHFWWTVNDCDCRSRVKLANLGQSFGFIWINKETYMKQDWPYISYVTVNFLNLSSRNSIFWRGRSEASQEERGSFAGNNLSLMMSYTLLFFCDF